MSMTRHEAAGAGRRALEADPRACTVALSEAPALCYLEPDRTETGEADAQCLFVVRLCHFFRPLKFGLRFSMNARTPSA